MHKTGTSLFGFLFPRVKLILSLGFLVVFNTGLFSNTTIGAVTCGSSDRTISPDSLSCIDQPGDTLFQMVHFHHSESGTEYFSVNLSHFHTRFERAFFYNSAWARQVFMADKSAFYNDSALFIAPGTKDEAWQAFREFLLETQNASVSFSEQEKQEYVSLSPFYKMNDLQELNREITPLASSNACQDAGVACSGIVYNFPSGTTGTAPPAVGGYPNYGCLASTPCPAWYYMQIGTAGNIVISISQVSTAGLGEDVDFICWGPFTSLSDGCSNGLTGSCTLAGCCTNVSPGCVYPKGNMVDCSFSPLPVETCHILNAQVGEIYILMITNFSQQAGTITFSQTGGTGLTNCNIVVHCSMIALTETPTACSAATNTFSVSGNVEFTNPSPTGTLTVTDNTAIPPVAQSFSPPFISPLAYNLTNIPCDGLTHLITARFSDSLNCTITQPVPAPPSICPQAHISGGGTICGDGIQQAAVTVNFTFGTPPFTFVYAINGINQPPVTCNNSLPYQINTTTAGLYTLVSVATQGCLAGTFSGSATVTVNPMPTATITGSASLCLNATPPLITFTGSNATPPYTFTYNINGGSSQTITTSSGNSVTLTVPTNITGSYSYNLTKVEESSSTTCSKLQSGNATVTIHPYPVTTITENPGPVCQASPHLYQAPADPSCNFTWSLIPAANGIIASGQGTNNITVDWQVYGGATVALTGATTAGCITSSTLATDVKPRPNPVFIPCFDLVTTPNAGKIILRGGSPLLPVQGVYSGNHVSLNTLTGKYEFDPLGAIPGLYPITYTYTNTYGCDATTAPVNITLQNSAFACGGKLTDVRNGKKYQTALLAGHCWMTQNLNYGAPLVNAPVPPQTDNCQAEKYCAPADTGCSVYGGFYQWDELMDYSTSSGIKGLCPPEWHIPSATEWQQLIDNLAAGITAPDANGVNGPEMMDPLRITGFHALTGGVDYQDYTWAFANAGNQGTLFWTSDSSGTDRAVARGLNSNNLSISNYNSSRGNAFSVRCVKD